ncbi:MAG: hypothetical protein SLAVMIC_00468 [uncultured marine phage]|uniref:Uncharacterized protein n=1 Tax=uncultured marine phage TaxID=707152 RepID=A0A8D9CCA1_9VIRU|nr:MAG: hypothetical protein SLAVMIC_00468 [uncultured marine phage]
MVRCFKAKSFRVHSGRGGMRYVITLDNLVELSVPQKTYMDVQLGDLITYYKDGKSHKISRVFAATSFNEKKVLKRKFKVFDLK